MTYSIFYSWQSDLPNNRNRSFIEQCIKQAIKITIDSFDVQLYFEYDRDTRDITGSPDISETIFKKINKSDLFICDVSIINSAAKDRKTPNPNVLIELGYAANVLGWERVICIFNTAYGSIDDLPFDLRQKRILTYNEDDKKQKVASIVADTLVQLHNDGLLFHPIKDHIKGKIDYCLLEIIKHFSCLLLGTLSMTDSLNKVNECLNLEQGDIEGKLKNGSSIFGFFAYNNLNEVKRKLETLLDIALSSKYTHDFWTATIIGLLDWLRSFHFYLSNRKGNLFRSVYQPSTLYKVVSAYEMNRDNPKDSYLLLKKVGVDKGKVLNTASLPYVAITSLLSPHYVNEELISEFALCLYRAIKLTKQWLNATGNEFILDPDYYHIY